MGCEQWHCSPNAAGEQLELATARALPRLSDCVFVPAAADQLAGVATEWAASRLPEALGCLPSGIQCLAPLTRVYQVLNSRLQARLNPPRPVGEPFVGLRLARQLVPIPRRVSR